MEKRVGQHRTDLVHIDAVLRLYLPDQEPESIKPKRPVPRSQYLGPGEEFW